MTTLVSGYRQRDTTVGNAYVNLKVKLLYRSMSSMKEYLTTMLVIPQESLYHLNFSVWAGWFYGVILGCRLVFLQGNEQDRHTCWESLPGEITKMLPDEMWSHDGWTDL